MNVNNFVIDRIVRGTMLSSTDKSVLWSLTQIQNPQLSMSSETVDAVDAMGSKIMTFERAKEATFSAENAIFDMDLLAAQAGTVKEVATVDKKIACPIFDILTVSEGKVTLTHEPLEEIPFIYVLNGDDTVSTPYKSGVESTAKTFKRDGKEITLPTEVTAGRVFVTYEYETDNAIQVVNKATEFPKAGEFVMEILGADVCDPTTLVHAYLIFPNCKLSSSTDLTLETEMTMGFELTASQSYCDAEKKLWRLVIPQAA